MPRWPATLVALITVIGSGCSSPGSEASRGPAGDTSRSADAPAGGSVQAHANEPLSGQPENPPASQPVQADGNPAGSPAAAAQPDSAPPPVSGAGPTSWTCKRQPFNAVLPLAEASGATLIPGPEGDVLLVVGDSGTRGQFLELDPHDGTVLASGRLPLGRGATDDLEGLSVTGDRVYGITSAGWMRHWRRHPERAAARRYELVRGPYPVATPATATSEHGPLVCDARSINCGRNYEGLCLRNPVDPAAACAGFAVSKTDGVLYCLVFQDDGALRIDPASPIAVAAAETLTGCHFAPDAAPDLVWVGSNAFGANRVFTVAGWQAPARARVDTVGMLGMGFGEAIAVGPAGALYRFSDTASDRSLADKYHCE